MKRFELTVFRQSRLYLGIFLSPFSIIGFIILAAKLGSPLIGISLFIIFILTFYYYVVGHLTIIIDNELLQFQWTKKYFFNYKDIVPVKLIDIKTIIIDNGQFLRKIKTNDRTICINNGKLKPKDAPKFINELGFLTKDLNAKTIDSWDVWVELGYLKFAYRLNIVIIITLATIVVTSVILGKANFRYFYMLLVTLPLLFLYGLQMKQKLKK
jgi:hypothetical protein